jgi:hypothetical protein
MDDKYSRIPLNPLAYLLVDGLGYGLLEVMGYDSYEGSILV